MNAENCWEIQARLPLLYHHRLSNEEHEHVMLHLGNCPECRRQLQSTFAFIKELKLELAPTPEPSYPYGEILVNPQAYMEKKLRQVVRSFIEESVPFKNLVNLIWEVY